MTTQTLDNLRSQVTSIDTTPMEGDFKPLAYLQFTGAAASQWAKDKMLPKSMYCMWAETSAQNLKAMGLNLQPVGAPTLFLRGFSDTESRDYSECNFSLTLKELPTETVPEPPQTLHKLGRFAFTADERAVFRGIGQGSLAQYLQLEIRMTTVVTKDDNNEEFEETWALLGYID